MDEQDPGRGMDRDDMRAALLELREYRIGGAVRGLMTPRELFAELDRLRTKEVTGGR